MSSNFPRLVFHQFWTEMSVIQGPKRKYVLDFPFLFWRPKMCGFGFKIKSEGGSLDCAGN